MFRISFLLLLALSAFGPLSWSQDCKLTLSGRVINENTGSPLENVNLVIESISRGTSSDQEGKFELTQLCAGSYHVYASHLGCETRRLFLTILSDTSITIYLDHQNHNLQAVTITGEAKNGTLSNTHRITETRIQQLGSKTLGEMLTDFQGVSAIKTGNGISKPVINGMSGNRLLILNQGISQSGQQWGADHAPEIDPLSASSIQVVRGAGTIEYQGSNLGNIVILESAPIAREPHIHGKLLYSYSSNGRGSTASLKLEQQKERIGWRFQLTGKYFGDLQSAKYYLTNTGSREFNFNTLVQYKHNKHVKSEWYLSGFNNEAGILRGSHIGNLSDLEAAYSREIPFYTDSSFSYSITYPYQQVNHYLLKYKINYFINKSLTIQGIASGQSNNRKEFDVRRNTYLSTPSLSILQFTGNFQVLADKKIGNTIRIKTGIQQSTTDNTNNPETGILPLIPDYLSSETGIFLHFLQVKEKYSLEAGARTDGLYRQVLQISSTLPREIIHYQEQKMSYHLTAGINYHPKERFNASINLGYAERIPGINELYSFGLHQGVSGIEEGDSELINEQSLKVSSTFNLKRDERFNLEVFGFYQPIRNYIFLKPTGENRLTIRGAFPVFAYNQEDAELYGSDIKLVYSLHESIQAVASYSIIRGYHRKIQQFVINLPSDKLLGEIRWEMPEGKRLYQPLVAARLEYHFKQSYLATNQDLVPVPDAYFLLGMESSAQLELLHHQATVYVRIENILNQTYRNYMNRYRYFADDTGINVQVGFNVSI